MGSGEKRKKADRSAGKTGKTGKTGGAGETGGVVPSQSGAGCRNGESGAALIISAVSNLMHDLRNSMTALSFCAGDHREGRQEKIGAGRPEESAILCQALNSMKCLADEYRGIETISRADTPEAWPGSAIFSFARLLDKSGLGAASIEVGPEFTLSNPRLGLVSRALVRALIAMVQVRAAGVRIKAFTVNGVTAVEVHFTSGMGREDIMNSPLQDAQRLVRGRGGDATVEVDGNFTKFRIELVDLRRASKDN